MITIKEIAELAEVSKGTVDRALNDRPGISQKSREKILKIAKEHNYVVNRNAKKLKSFGEEKIIGVLMSKRAELYYKRIMDGLIMAKNDIGDTKLKIKPVFVDNFDEESILKGLEIFKEKKVAGIVAAVMNTDKIAGKMNEIIDSGIPVITLVTDVECKRICFFGENAVQVGRLSASLFTKMLKKDVKLLVVVGNPKFTVHEKRLAGIKEFMKLYGINYDIRNIILSEEKYKSSYEKIKMALEKDADINSVYLSSNDYEALSAVMKDLDLTDKLSVVGCQISFFDKKIKTGCMDFIIDTKPEDIGYKAFEMMYNHIVFKDTPTTDKNYIQVEIKIPESFNPVYY